MGISEYFKTSTNDSRWKLSAILSIGLHIVVLGAGSWVMTQKAEYGMAGAVAGGGKSREVQPPVEDTVELDDSDVPAERTHKAKPKPTPAVPVGMGGPKSAGALEVPSYYRNPPPDYPDSARRLKEEGVVMLHTEVDVQGKVALVTVSQSSGFADLDESAVETVKNWQFKPAQIAGIPIAASVNIPIRFRLKDIR